MVMVDLVEVVILLMEQEVLEFYDKEVLAVLDQGSHLQDHQALQVVVGVVLVMLVLLDLIQQLQVQVEMDYPHSKGILEFQYLMEHLDLHQVDGLLEVEVVDLPRLPAQLLALVELEVGVMDHERREMDLQQLQILVVEAVEHI